jgi:CheY-like chemotaxis protein
VPTKILVADDSATMRRVLEMTFAGEDARVLSVDNGEAAVAKAGELVPDVVFADASMSGVDGYEVARRIKSSPQLAKVAVIVMASQHTPYDDGKGRAAGVDDHIPKPFDTQSVIDKLAQVLARPRAMLASAGGEAPRPAPPAPRPAAVGAPPPPAPAPAPARSAVGNATRMGIGGPVVPQQPAPVARPAPIPAAASAAPQPVRSAAPAPAAAAVAAPAPAARPAPAPAPAAALDTASATMAQKLSGLGLSREQVEGVLALSREVVEQVVWEVVPVLAEQLIKEEIKRLTAE